MITLTLRWDASGHPHQRALAQGETALLGRSPDADVTVSGDQRIHRKHARITWEGGDPVVTALGVNGVHLASQDRHLRKGESGRMGAADRIVLGQTPIGVRYESNRGEVKIRCHGCAAVLPYEPHEMCPHCGMALAVGHTVEH